MSLLSATCSVAQAFRRSTTLLSSQPLHHHHLFSSTTVMDPIAAAQAAVTKQGDTVRSLKAQLKEGKVEKVSGCLCARVCTCVCSYTDCSTSVCWCRETGSKQAHTASCKRVGSLILHTRTGSRGRGHQAAPTGQDRPGYGDKGESGSCVILGSFALESLERACMLSRVHTSIHTHTLSHARRSTTRRAASRQCRPRRPFVMSW